MILNTLLIICYNINNYLFIICSNKKYTTSEDEAFFRVRDEKLFKNNKSIIYNCSFTFLCIIIILQNIVLIQALENYINLKFKIYYWLITTILLFFILLFLIVNILSEYNYRNMINSLINILFFFCFYSIIFDLILFITRNKLISLLYELIYNFQKFLLSYFNNILIHIKLRISLENIIRDILFQEKIHNKEHLFIPAFTYLNEIMLKIKEKNDHKSNILLLKFLYKHMNICDKIKCNCKLLKIFFKNKKIENNNNGNISSNLLITLNFLYEISFLEYDYFNKYEMIILLSEHFCHIRDNPIMAFSLINSLIINNTTLSKFQMVDLYELCQKYY